MRRFLPFAVVLVLAACSAPNASVTEQTPPPEPAAVVPDDGSTTREETMQACGTDGCSSATVHFTGDVANVMQVGTGPWLVLTQSQCSGTSCTVTDQNGAAWKLER